MTLTLEPTPHELDILCREARRRGMSVEKLVPLLLIETIEEIEYPERVPNAETIAAIKEARSGGGTVATDVADMFRQCGV